MSVIFVFINVVHDEHKHSFCCVVYLPHLFSFTHPPLMLLNERRKRKGGKVETRFFNFPNGYRSATLNNDWEVHLYA